MEKIQVSEVDQNVIDEVEAMVLSTEEEPVNVDAKAGGGVSVE